MKGMHNIVDSFSLGERFGELTKSREKRLLIRGLVGSSFAVTIAAHSKVRSGVHLIIAENKDGAAYIANDLTELIGEERVMFFPSAAKRSVVHDGEDLSQVVLRTAALSAISNIKKGETLYICSYPEAMCEKVITNQAIEDNSIRVAVEDTIEIAKLIEQLISYEFKKVDFVYEPGQFSVRGGIVDIFSYGENQPYRLDFFGDSVDSIRLFDIASQRSEKSLTDVVIVPYIREITSASMRVPFTQYTQSKGRSTTIWFENVQQLSDRLTDIYKKVAAQRDNVSDIVTTGDELLAAVGDSSIIYLRNEHPTLPANRVIEFDTTLQPSFNKNFELLATNIDENLLKGYQTYILTRNKAQIERLENIFRRATKISLLNR